VGASWLTQGLDEASMGKASRTKVDASRREKIAAQRAAERRAEQRRRILIASGSIVAVIANVVAYIVIKANNKPSSGNSSNGPTGAALSSVVSKVTSVPASTLDKVGDGSGSFTGKIQAVSGGTPLTANGKPEMLYMGAEYCPYCAAERWSMIVALSRFGTFSGLSTVHSSTTDTPSNISTFTFHGSSYTSKYLTFTPVEMETNIPDPSTGRYTTLETPTN
jgi:thiol-disulfide isomerase/thioredoxin